MARNPYFLQGSKQEQYLLQDLINEQLKIYGIDVYYIPRKIIGTETLSREVTMSKLDDNFIIEAYLDNYEGYGGNTDIMTKFGIELRNEISLTISREKFDTYIVEFLKDLKEQDASEIILDSRPREGDVIYFPLGERLYEIKNVEHEKPFFQLGENYVYQLQCELLRLEDEIINTGVAEIDDAVIDEGYITTINLTGSGINATATAGIALTGSVRKVQLNNDGYNYTSAPTVAISTAPVGGTNATAVAITTSNSILEVLITNAGAGYTEVPTITFSGGGGVGAAATAILGDGSVQTLTITNPGSLYVNAPIVTLAGSANTSIGSSAEVISTIGTGGTITEMRIRNAGFGYTVAPTVGISTAPSIGTGIFISNEIVTGSLSGATARVKKYDKDAKTLDVYINSGTFTAGEDVVGATSNATHTVSTFNSDPGIEIEYAQNEEIENLADDIVDFTESNPFGTY
jgi:hypothetical protein